MSMQSLNDEAALIATLATQIYTSEYTESGDSDPDADYYVPRADAIEVCVDTAVAICQEAARRLGVAFNEVPYSDSTTRWTPGFTSHAR
jgi:hypothetical protein